MSKRPVHYKVTWLKKSLVQKFGVCSWTKNWIGNAISMMYVSGKISRGIGVILKARKLLNLDSLVTVYHSLIYPYHTYCNHVWSATYASNIRIVVLLRKNVSELFVMLHREIIQNFLRNWDFLNSTTSSIWLDDSCIDGFIDTYQKCLTSASNMLPIFIILIHDNPYTYLYHMCEQIWVNLA